MEREKVIRIIEQIYNDQAKDFILCLVDGVVGWKTLNRELTPEEWKSIGYVGGLAAAIDLTNYRVN